MTPNDAARARSRFLAALRRIAKGLELQRERIMRRTAEAPKRFGGTDEHHDAALELSGVLATYLRIDLNLRPPRSLTRAPRNR